MKQTNLWIRKMLTDNELTQYQLANEMGISDYTLIRWLRYDLTEDRATKVDKGLSRLLSKNKKEDLDNFNFDDFSVDDFINTDPRLDKDQAKAIKELISLGMSVNLQLSQEASKDSLRAFNNFNHYWLTYNDQNIQKMLDDIDKVTED